MASVHFIYGSTSGNTQMVVEKVAALLTEAGHKATVQRVELSSTKDLKGQDVFILACSTYGHGVLQEHFAPFAEALKKEKLSGKQFAVIGLGDSLYDAEYNVESAPILESIITECGGELVAHALRLNKSPVHHTERIERWARDLAKKIEKP